MLNSKSFSLIEVLVAITVIVVGLIGVMGLVVYNLSISRASMNKVIAVNLAQEGIEIVRNIRDSNILKRSTFDNGIATENIGVTQYFIPRFIDTDSDGMLSDENPSISGYKLVEPINNNIDSGHYLVYYDSDINDMFYAQKIPTGTDPEISESSPSGWDPTSNPEIHRQIRITKQDINGIDYYLQIKSQVLWIDRTGTHNIILEEHLYDYDVAQSQIKYKYEVIPGPTTYYDKHIWVCTSCDWMGMFEKYPTRCTSNDFNDFLGEDVYIYPAYCDNNADVDCPEDSLESAFEGDPDYVFDGIRGGYPEEDPWLAFFRIFEKVAY